MINNYFSNKLHRCKISECDAGDKLLFQPDWLKYAIPFKDGNPENCRRYEINENVTSIMCDAHSFNHSNIRNCAYDTLIYHTDEVSIINEVNYRQYKFFERKEVKIIFVEIF